MKESFLKVPKAHSGYSSSTEDSVNPPLQNESSLPLSANSRKSSEHPASFFDSPKLDLASNYLSSKDTL